MTEEVPLGIFFFIMKNDLKEALSNASLNKVRSRFCSEYEGKTNDTENAEGVRFRVY